MFLWLFIELADHITKKRALTQFLLMNINVQCTYKDQKS